MSSIWVLIGQATPLEALDPTKTLGKTGGLILRDVLLIAGAVLVLTVVLVFWARSWVGRSKRRRHHRSRSESSVVEGTTEGAREHRHHRRRRRRRDHRGRNPTLEETGGLPPSRSETSATPRT